MYHLWQGSISIQHFRTVEPQRWRSGFERTSCKRKVGCSNLSCDITCTKTSCLTLTFDNVTCKSLVVIYVLRATTVPSLAACQQRYQEILSGHHLNKDQQYDLKLIGNTYSRRASKFGNFQAKWLKDIKRTSFDQQSDRRTYRCQKKNMPHFSKK